VARRWPAARWHREWPLLHGLAIGTLVRGTADLVLELPDGFVVVDHKSFPGSVADAVARAAGYAPQLGAYASAITAARGKPVHACFVHLPVAGIVVPVAPRAASDASVAV
jgi:ATP-dependent helicase/nuclease subunit A